MRTAYGRWRGLTQSEGSDFALLDEHGHRSHGVFNRHLRVDSMLIIKIDDFHSKPLQARFTGSNHEVWPPIGKFPASTAKVPELCRQAHLIASMLDGAADKFLIMASAVGVSRVEEGHAVVECCMDYRLTLLVADLVVYARERHAAETDWRDDHSRMANLARWSELNAHYKGPQGSDSHRKRCDCPLSISTSVSHTLHHWR